MTVIPHLSAAQLLAAARSESRPKVARRIQAVAMAQQLLTSARIAELTGDDQRSIRRWVRRYNRDGLDALADAPRSGRPPKLPRDQEQAFKDRIAAGPTAEDLARGVSVMHGKDYQRILEVEFGKVYGLNGVYELLHRLGYSWLMPRPQHEQADEQAQADFKKTLSNKSQRFRPSTWANASRSGFKTKHASVSKARSPESGLPQAPVRVP